MDSNSSVGVIFVDEIFTYVGQDVDEVEGDDISLMVETFMFDEK